MTLIDFYYIDCPHCDTNNRIPTNRTIGNAKCGKCKASLVKDRFECLGKEAELGSIDSQKSVKESGFSYNKLNEEATSESSENYKDNIGKNIDIKIQVEGSCCITAANLAMFNNMYEEAYLLLSDVNDKSHKIYSILISASILTFRYEEATCYFKEYCQLIAEHSHYSTEFEEEFQKMKIVVSELKFNELNLPKYLKGDYPQSREGKSTTYPETVSFMENENLDPEKLKTLVKNNELLAYSDCTEIRGNANLFLGQYNFALGRYDEAYKYYLDAAKNIPTKALHYGYAAQSLLRFGRTNSNIEYSLRYKFSEKIILIRRAIKLDPENPHWHMLLMQFILQYYLVNKCENEIVGESMRQQMKSELDIARK